MKQKLLMLVNTSSRLPYFSHIGIRCKDNKFYGVFFLLLPITKDSGDKCCLPEAAEICSLAAIRTCTLCFLIASTVQAFITIALNIFLPGICRQCREKHNKTEELEVEGASPCGKQEQVG